MKSISPAAVILLAAWGITIYWIVKAFQVETTKAPEAKDESDDFRP